MDIQFVAHDTAMVTTLLGAQDPLIAEVRFGKNEQGEIDYQGNMETTLHARRDGAENRFSELLKSNPIRLS